MNAKCLLNIHLNENNLHISENLKQGQRRKGKRNSET